MSNLHAPSLWMGTGAGPASAVCLGLQDIGRELRQFAA